MENNPQDEYTVIVCRTKTKYYYKNGVLHRETGPAIIHKFHQDEYSNLSDESLYELVEIDDFAPKGFNSTYVEEEIEGSSRKPYRAARHYLNGQPYSKKEFEKMKKQLELKNELSSELNVNQNNTKKSKL